MVTDDSKSEPPDRPERPEPFCTLPRAWQPLTWTGVAAFSQSSLTRLLVVQTLVALLAAGVMLWFLATGWFPAIRQAIRRLPETGAIENQELISPRVTGAPLVQNRLLAIVVSTTEDPSPSLASDLRFEFRRRKLVVCSLFGCRSEPYPKEWVLGLNRPELQSWWGAWEPMMYTMAGLSMFCGLFLSWFLQATVYAPLLRVCAFFSDRKLTCAGAWRLAAAALLPAALVATLAVALYASGVLDLIRFLALWLLHFLVPWAYLVMSPRRLDAVKDAPIDRGPRNPFENDDAGNSAAPNPFR